MKWIRLPGLRMSLYDRVMIRAIVLAFAEFLDIDEKTKDMTALSYARVCVELDVLQKPPNKIWINLPGDKGYYQDIIIEGGIQYCLKCKIHEHDLVSCMKRKVNADPKIVSGPEHMPNMVADNGVVDNTGNLTSKGDAWQKPKKVAMRAFRKEAQNKGIENNGQEDAVHLVEEVDEVSDKENEVQDCESDSTKGVEGIEGLDGTDTGNNQIHSERPGDENNEQYQIVFCPVVGKSTATNMCMDVQVDSDVNHISGNHARDENNKSKKVGRGGTLPNFDKRMKVNSPPRTRSKAKGVTNVNNKADPKGYIQLTEQQIQDALHFGSNPENGAHNIPSSLRLNV